jgi:hypothetical protein
MKNNIDIKIHFYIFLPVLFIFFPTFPNILSGYLGSQIVFIMEIICIVFCGILGVYKSEFSLISFSCFLFFVLLTVISILCELANGSIISNDLFELSRPFAFLLFFLFYRNSKVDVTLLEGKTFKVIFFILLVTSIYSIAEIIFSNILLPVSLFLYKDNRPVLLYTAIGSFEVTYQYAYILLLPLIYYFLIMIKSFSIKNLIYFIIFIITFLLTQSKSLYITFAVSLFVILCLPCLYKKLKTAVRLLSVIILFTGISCYIFITYYDELKPLLGYAIGGLEAISKDNSRSVDNRKDQILWSIENNKLVLIGGGIGKSRRMLESFWSLYYFRYGIIGMLVYLLIPLTASFASYKIAVFIHNKEISNFYLSLCVFYLITPIGLLSACHQDTPKVSIIFYGLIGLIFKRYHSILKTPYKERQ